MVSGVADHYLDIIVDFIFKNANCIEVLTSLGYEVENRAGFKSDFIIASSAVVSTLVIYFIFFGIRHVQRRFKLQNDKKALENKLEKAFEEIQKLIDEKEKLSRNESQKTLGKKEIRIWMDGAFDMMHFGHMNAFRQGRALGTYLVVGINSDESITTCKGTAPVMNDDERTAIVAGCKFVDEVEPNCPYVMNEEYLNHVIKKHQIDYVVHGDDPCIVDGKDVYDTAKKMGKYKSIPRTEGISTTELVGRMLLMTKTHHQSTDDAIERKHSLLSAKKDGLMEKNRSKFLTTNRMLRLFSAGYTSPMDSQKVIYIDGGWDMFHAGHVQMLKKAKEQGDYLIVGVHSDKIVNLHRGSNHPIMNLQERVLSVLGCKYVDDVLIDAPWSITEDMMASLKIHKVVTGTKHDSFSDNNKETRDAQYVVAKKRNKYLEIQSDSNLTVSEIVRRIHANEEKFRAKFEKKMKSEKEYYDNRYGRDGTEEVEK